MGNHNTMEGGVVKNDSCVCVPTFICYNTCTPQLDKYDHMTGRQA